MKSEGAKTFYGVVIIILVFVLAYTTINSPTEEDIDLSQYQHLTYLAGFPYHLPVLDIQVTDDFSPWARRTGLQATSNTFLHLMEFRIDQETNTVHTKIGVTSPRHVPLEQVVMTFRGHSMVWTHRNQDVMWLEDSATYFRFTMPVRYFRNEGLGPMQWHLQEANTEGFGETLIFEATIER